MCKHPFQYVFVQSKYRKLSNHIDIGIMINYYLFQKFISKIFEISLNILNIFCSIYIVREWGGVKRRLNWGCPLDETAKTEAPCLNSYGMIKIPPCSEPKGMLSL